MPQIITKWMKPNESPEWFGAIDHVCKVDATSFRLKPWWKLWWMDSKLRNTPKRLTCMVVDHDYVRYSNSNRITRCYRCGKFLTTRTALY